jgi:TRAP-type C4-dicarboxylate transport system permease small subunit
VHADVQESIAIGTGTIRNGTSDVYLLNLPVIRYIDIWSNRLSRWLMVVAAIWAFLLAFYILADVVGRFFGFPLRGTHEVVKNSIVMIAFMQAAYCVASRSMLRADVLLHWIGGKPERIINSAGFILGALFFAALFIGTMEPAWHAIVSGEFEGEGALRVPTWPARVVVLLTSALLVVNYSMLALKEILQSRLGDSQPAAAN